MKWLGNHFTLDIISTDKLPNSFELYAVCLSLDSLLFSLSLCGSPQGCQRVRITPSDLPESPVEKIRRFDFTDPCIFRSHSPRIWIWRVKSRVICLFAYARIALIAFWDWFPSLPVASTSFLCACCPPVRFPRAPIKDACLYLYVWT